MLTEDALKGYSRYTKNEISHARYKAGGTYYEVPIDEMEITESNQLSVWITCDRPEGEKVTISEVQLIDTGGKVFLKQPENMILDTAQEGGIFNILFTFKEVEADAAS